MHFVNGGLNLWRMIIKFGEIPETIQHIVNGSFVAVGLVCFVLSIRELQGLPIPAEFVTNDSSKNL